MAGNLGLLRRLWLWRLLESHPVVVGRSATLTLATATIGPTASIVVIMLTRLALLELDMVVVTSGLSVPVRVH